MEHKKLLHILIAFLLLPGLTKAQAVSGQPPVFHHTAVKDSIPKPFIGIKLGASSNYLSGDRAFNQAYTQGVTAGAFMDFRKKWYGVQLEAQVATAKHTLQDSFLTGGYINILYLDIPVLFECRLFPGLWLQVGPQIGTLMSVTQHPSTIVDLKTLFQSNNFSGVIGLEGKLPLHLSVGARYLAGISNLNNGNLLNPNQAWRTTNLQFYIGYHFL